MILGDPYHLLTGLPGGGRDKPSRWDWVWPLLSIVAVFGLIILPIVAIRSADLRQCMQYEKRSRFIPEKCTQFSPGGAFGGGMLFGGWGAIAGGLMGAGCEPERVEHYYECVRWDGVE